MKLTREQLYDAIWKTPTVRLAKSYGISDVALAKICRKFAIPKPGLGYWRLVELGRLPKRPALPLSPKNNSPIIEITPSAIAKAILPMITPEIVSIRAGENKIRIAEDFRGAHPLVRSAKALLQKGYVNREGRINPDRNERCIAVRVTKACQNRALLIMDALFKAVEGFGNKVVIAEQGQQTHFKIGDEAVRITLMEKVVRSDRELTAEEKRGAYLFDRWIFTPTGKLIFRIDEYFPEGGRRNWSDGENQVLEDQLDEILETVFVTAEALRLKSLERAEETRKWEGERKRLEELEKIRRAELEKRNVLIQQADLWIKSKHLLAFIEAAAEQLQNGNTVNANASTQWLEWAKGVADQMNPLKTDYLEKTIASLTVQF